MNNTNLFRRIKKLVSTERRIGVAILDCLYEIEIRRAYAELKYDGLYTYCIRELGFTESQAYQRIQAMRALRDLPELKPLIESGSLSVSAVAKVQTHLKQEVKEGIKRENTGKLELFHSMQNCTSREVEVKLAEVRGSVLKEKLVIEMDESLAAIWNQVKGLAAHRSGGDQTEVFRIIASEWLARNNPAREKNQNQRPAKARAVARVSDLGLSDTMTTQEATNTRNTNVHEKTSASKEELRRAVPLLGKSQEASLPLFSESKITLSEGPQEQIPPQIPERRFLSAALRRHIWQRDEGKCTRCGSTHALEIEHLLPYALGGGHDPENLTLHCRSCNQFKARRYFGTHKIESISRGLPTPRTTGG